MYFHRTVNSSYGWNTPYYGKDKEEGERAAKLAPYCRKADESRGSREHGVKDLG